MTSMNLCQFSAESRRRATGKKIGQDFFVDFAVSSGLLSRRPRPVASFTDKPAGLVICRRQLSCHIGVENADTLF